jgi:hypothetical protein
MNNSTEEIVMPPLPGLFLLLLSIGKINFTPNGVLIRQLSKFSPQKPGRMTIFWGISALPGL